MAASVGGSMAHSSVAAEARRAQHAEPVLREALDRVADGAQDPRVEILLPAERIDERPSADRWRWR